jgi:hypothetical protein
MVRKAEEFRRRAERTVPKRAKSAVPRRRRDTPVDTSQPGVSASDRKVGEGSTGARNRSAAAEKKAGYVLEDSTTARPTRKSTRSGINRVKSDANLRRRQMRKVAAPKSRATRSEAAGTKASATKRTTKRARPTGG